jgi:hypothetical protein
MVAEGEDPMADVVPGVTRRSVSALGFRRVEFVCLIVDEQGTSAEVTGVTHRLPRTIRVPLHTANALIEAGVPRRVETRHHTHILRSQAPVQRPGG